MQVSGMLVKKLVPGRSRREEIVRAGNGLRLNIKMEGICFVKFLVKLLNLLNAQWARCLE